MKELIVPKALKSGDTIALISISGGRAGDSDMLYRYERGKERLEEIWGVRAVTTPNALKGSQYLYENPEARAEDMVWALTNDEVKGIICLMGGDDSYRVIPLVDEILISENPKVFMGYSDIASWMAAFAHAGVRAYYGPNVLTPIAQPGELDEYTKQAITKCLFTTEIIGEIKPCTQYTKIEWGNPSKDEIHWTPNTGYSIAQGTGIVQGRLFGGSGGPLNQIKGMNCFPNRACFEDCILLLESGAGADGGILGYLHELRALAAVGMIEKAAGIITCRLNEEEQKVLLKFLRYEMRRPDIPVLTNVDFVHRTPMTVIPMGAMAEIDCDKATLMILESGVR